MRFAVKITKTHQANPLDSAFPSLSGTIIAIRDSQTRTDELDRDIYTIPNQTYTVANKEVQSDGQVATVTMILAPGDQSITPDALLVSGDVQSLGNWSLKTTTTVGEVFPATVLSNQHATKIPERFYAAGTVVRRTESSAAGDIATPATLGTDGTGIIEATAQRIHEKRVRNSQTEIVGTVHTTLTTYRSLPDGQSATIVETRGASNSLPSIDGKTVSAEVTAIGGDQYIIRDERVDLVQPFPVKTVKQTVIPPREFLTITADVTLKQTIEDSSVQPASLGSNGLGVVESTAAQNEVYKGDVTTRTLTGSFSDTLTEHQRNQFGQVVHITKSWVNDGSAPVLDALTDIATVQAVGDGIFLRTIGVVDTLFAQASYSVEKTNRVPSKFRQLIPEVETSSVVAGTATTPTLGADDTFASESQLTDFTKRVTRRTLDFSGGTTQTLTGSRYIPELNVIATVTEVYSDAGGLTVSTGENILESEVETFGSGNQIKTTVSFQDPAPIQSGGESDPFTGTPIIETRQRVPMGFPVPAAKTGTVYSVEVHGNYCWLVTRVYQIPKSYTKPGLVSIRLPNVLKGINIYQSPPDPTTGALSPIQLYAQYDRGGGVTCPARIVVKFTASPQKPTIPVLFKEASWDLPGFSGSGLTDAQPVRFLGTSNEITATLPASTPSAQTWLGMVGTEQLCDYHCSEWVAGIFKEENYYAVVP
jgi:hypothetical protein